MLVDDAADISELYAVGVDVKEESWMKRAIRNFCIAIPVTEELEEILRCNNVLLSERCGETAANKQPS